MKATYDMDIIKPPKLKSGDLVGIISPSSPVISKRDLSRGMKILESLGFRPKLAPRALEVHASYQAGTREARLSDFHTMFADDEVRGIFCTSGGYASVQLLQDIDWDIIRKNPKVFVGYSDITTLLNPMYEKSGLITFHGPMIEGLMNETKGGQYTVRNLKEAVMRGDSKKLTPFTEWKTLKLGKAEGNLVGGNLNVLTALLGTPYEPKWDGKILFWEEVDETIEGLDNYLWRLRISKVFKKIDGMIIGKVTNLQSIEDDDNDKWATLEKPPTLEDVILRATEGFNFPIIYGVDFGHDVPSLTLPIGARASINCPATGRIGSISILDKYLD